MELVASLLPLTSLTDFKNDSRIEPRFVTIGAKGSSRTLIFSFFLLSFFLRFLNLDRCLVFSCSTFFFVVWCHRIVVFLLILSRPNAVALIGPEKTRPTSTKRNVNATIKDNFNSSMLSEVPQNTVCTFQTHIVFCYSRLCVQDMLNAIIIPRCILCHTYFLNNTFCTMIFYDRYIDFLCVVNLTILLNL